MPYINTETKQYPVTEQDIRNSLPNTSFATPFNPDGYAYVFPTPQPTFDALSQYVREIAPILSTKKTWEQQWEIVDLSPEQVADNIEAKRIAAIAQSVSPRQIRQALTAVGLRQAVEDAIAAGDQDLKDWYEFATAFERNNEHVIEMSTALNVTERQLDDLFTLAGTL